MKSDDVILPAAMAVVCLVAVARLGAEWWVYMSAAMVGWIVAALVLEIGKELRKGDRP